MGDLIPFRGRRQASATLDTRIRIEGALALALDAVDQLVAALDDLDGDPNLNDSADTEPSLGTPEGHASQIIWLGGGDWDVGQS